MTAVFKMIRYVAFDLDGTLVDSVPDLAQAIRMTLADLGKESVTDEDVRAWIGNGAEVMLKRALSRNVVIDPDLDVSLYEIARARFDDYYANNGHSNTLVYPQVLSTLTALKDAGFKMGIVTNKPAEFVPAILGDIGLSAYFSDVIGGDTLPTNKPHPAGLLSLCEKHGLTKEEIVMVGDSKNDILAAQNAGIASVGLTYGYNYGEPISDSAPTVTADKFGELLDILNQTKKA